MASLVGKVASETTVSKLAKLNSIRTISTSKNVGKERRVGQIDLKDQSSMAALKKGPGYRSSFSGMVATVFGASGMVGITVCNRLGKGGSQMILPYRGEHYDFMRLKVCGDLGQVLFTPYNLNDEESIRRSMAHSNIVINLIGQEWNTKNFSLNDVHVTGPARLARIARESGVERFIHISHLNARENPQQIFMPTASEYLKTKWYGEGAVLNEFPDATIFRPADMYGPRDKFIHSYLRWMRYGYAKRMPLWKKGNETVKRPLHFADLGAGITNALADPSSKGQIYEAYGPESYLLGDLIDWMHGQTWRFDKDFGYKRTDLRTAPLPFIKALISQNLPFGTKFFGNASLDRLERSCMNDDVQGLPSLYDLGVKPESVLDKMKYEMEVYRVNCSWMPKEDDEWPYFPDLHPLSRLEEKALLAKGRIPFFQSIGLA